MIVKLNWFYTPLIRTNTSVKLISFEIEETEIVSLGSSDNPESVQTKKIYKYEWNVR